MRLRAFALVFATVFAVAFSVNAQVVTDGLIGYWSLDSDSIDGSAVSDLWGENNGVLDGDPQIVAGKFGEALEFDGDDSVEIAGTESLNFNEKNELAVTVWVKAASDEPVIGVVAGCCGSVVAQRDVSGWALRFDGRNPDAEMEFIAHTATAWVGDAGFGVPRFAPDEWHHLAAVISGDALQLYLDGEFMLEEPFEGAISSTGSETEIGRATDGGFVGTIDEVAIYGRALSEADVQANFLASGFTAVEAAGKLATRWGEIKASH